MKASPDRYTFQRDMYMKRQQEKGLTKENDKETALMLEYYQDMIDDHKNKDKDEEFKKNNLEYDLRSAEWICLKAKNCETYSQNLYAALCNNSFKKVYVDSTPENVVKILKEGLEPWSCSWRYAGGIVADMREEGDYINWYCSGIRDYEDDESSRYNARRYVSESTVTDEIREDLKTLGWLVVEDSDFDI